MTRPARFALLAALLTACSASNNGTHPGQDGTGGNDATLNDSQSPGDDTVSPADDTQSSTDVDAGGGVPDAGDDPGVAGYAPGTACLPGATHECYPGDPFQANVGICRPGSQSCLGQGELGTWSDCMDAVLPEGEQCDGMDHDCDGTPNNGVPCACTPNEVRECYTGPANTSGVGVCRSGTQACDASGASWGDCVGQVFPGQEACNNVDDDCNGLVDDGLNCVCHRGEVRDCYSGPAGTQGVGICVGGRQGCNNSGTSWSVCGGEVVPRAETCNGIDDDCNGRVDDGINCVCSAGQSQTCYDGAPGTSGVGICRSGRQTCSTSGMGWGACAGEVTPTSEVCFNDVDDNCNGQIDEGCPACDSTAVIFANTESGLYAVSPTTFNVRFVGNFAWPSDGHSHQMTDIAANASGQILGVTFDALYRVNRTTAQCTLIAPLAAGEMFNALTFLPAATTGGVEKLVAAASSGDYFEINQTTGAGTLIGNYGSGAGSDGDLVAVQGAGTFATVDLGTVGASSLARVNSMSGTVAVVGSTGVSDVWGLGYWSGTLYGFLTEGAIVTIDPATGVATRVASTPDQSWWGAAVTTCAPTN